MSERQHCPGCSGYLPREEGPKIEDILGISPCPGLPASRLRILPPRPPNVAALLTEEESLPATKVEAVRTKLQSALVFLENLDRADFCYDNEWDDFQQALKRVCDALAALNRKES